MGSERHCFAPKEEKTKRGTLGFGRTAHFPKKNLNRLTSSSKKLNRTLLVAVRLRSSKMVHQLKPLNMRQVSKPLLCFSCRGQARLVEKSREQVKSLAGSNL
ncbi:hypothetical protein SLEP1_g34487 [Rubroshorea leprosula]|uniref:Uncharacterized protein n=1 Tax=Rubroshorea leprosula TaxID=152421 RepID=A0AAV5KK30_9ROSI|nr:hypothetical protein SLEP1_g34487 [Rubroshorea leprosula]